MNRIKLKKRQLAYLENFIKTGNKSARAITRANILRLSHEGKTEEEIAKMLAVCRATVCNIKSRYRLEGLENALDEKPRSGQPIKYGDKHKAEIIALSCSNPPEGRERWTLELLAEHLVKNPNFKDIPDINHESIRLILKKATQSHG